MGNIGPTLQVEANGMPNPAHDEHPAMKLLALDTSTEACSAALFINGRVSVRYRLAPREHSKLILDMLDQLLAEAELKPAALDGLAYGRGPGSFTGVRIAASTVQGIALGLDLPVVPVSSLAALAQGMRREVGSERVLTAIDARMQEVYWASYRLGADGLMELVGDERVVAPADVPVPGDRAWHGAGSGWDSYRDILVPRLAEQVSEIHAERFPSAEDIALLGAAGLRGGRGLSAERALPVYLRDRVAARPGS